MGALHLALSTYKEQHAAILEAIVVFTGEAPYYPFIILNYYV
jgi:hypothetical protein